MNNDDNNEDNYNGWKVGDICYRKNEKCKIKQIDFNTNPPSLIVEVLSDRHEINTEFTKITRPPTINQPMEIPMDEQTKKDLSQIQQWFMGLTIVKDEDLTQFIPDILPKLLFKLNNKQLHSKLQSEILQMIQHISSRIQAQPDGYPLIPVNVLIQMLIEHISYYNHNKSFYVSPFFLNLSLTFIDMAFKMYYQSLHSTHLSTKLHSQRTPYPKVDLNITNNKKSFITKELITSVFKLLTFIDKFPNPDQSYKLFHLFIQILPFIQYSNDNIDRNAKVFSCLFKIDFDALIDKMHQIQKEKAEKQQQEQHKILKKGYDDDADTVMKVEQKDDNDTESEDDEEEDDEEDIQMIDLAPKEEIDIVTKLTKDRDLDIKKTAVILLHETPVIPLPHIVMLLDYCTDFLLCRYMSTSSSSAKTVKTPPGLSQIVHDKISKHYSLCHNQWQLEQLHKSIMDLMYHIGIVCEMLCPEQVFIPALIASNSGNVQYVTRCADRLYSKIKSDTNMENEEIVAKLYRLYLGDTDKSIREAQRRIPCGSTLKLSIAQCLSKSNRGCNTFPNAVKVVFDAWFSKTTYAKLKLRGLEFTRQILHYAQQSVKLRKLTPVFKTGLLKLLKVKPNTMDEFVETNVIRNIAYGVLSQLSLIPNASKLFTKNTDILKLYFDRLEMERDTMTKESILDGLKHLKQCFERHLSSELSQRLLTFLLQRMDQKLTSNRSRVVILQWLNDIFPFNNPQIRMIHLFQLNHNDVHIKEYAKKGLLPRIKRDATDPQNKHYKLENYPLFDQFTAIAYQRIITNNTKMSEMVMKETLDFASKCLKGNAMIWCQDHADDKEDDVEMKDKECNPMLNWLESNDETNVFRNDSHYKSLSTQSKYIEHLMGRENTDFLNGLDKYMHLLLHSIRHFPISQSKTDTLHSIAFEHLLHLICICYPSFAHYKQLRIAFETLLLNETHLHLFYQRLLNDSILTRTQCAKLFAMIVCLNNTQRVIQQYESMLFKSIACHLSQRLKLKHRSNAKDVLKGTVQETIRIDGALKGLSCIVSAQLSLQSDISSDMILIAWISSAFVLSSNVDLIQSSCFALSMFGPYDIVRLLNKQRLLSSSALLEDAAQLKDIMNVIQLCDAQMSDALSLIEYLTLIVNRYNKNQSHIAECAIHALAAISRGVSNMNHLKSIEEYIVKLRKLPQHDLQFAIGSVWANIVFAADANKDSDHIDSILKEMCAEFMIYGNKLARCAACIWLLCMVRFSGNLTCIQDRLLQIQTAFISSLSDSNEFTVQCASKGLAHCYEMARSSGNRKAQNGLVSSLMSTLGGKKKKSGVRVHKDTEIQHKEGTSTYKELCQIATKLNSPSLAYRFLDLASNHAIWNSKRGAAFSLGSLLKISDELRDKMGDIIPILYRYQFDVNPQIRSTMQNMWRSVIGDEDAMIETHFDAIMKDVIAGLQCKEWRVRASTPLAVCALISGKRFEQVSAYLSSLMSNLLLVVQDINSMVKKSAIQMSQSMIRLIQRLCDSEVTPSKNIAATLSIILPHIAIETRSKEVQVLSVAVLIAICTKKTGAHLCPHLKRLIRILLIGLSTLEPAQLNMLAVQDEGAEFSRNLESARLQMSRHNPLNNALDICIDLIDDIGTIDSVIPELCSIIRGGIGLNSIAAACKIANNLASKEYLRRVLRKHSRRVISALCGQVVVTASPHLRTQYCAVIGHWLRLSKKKSVEQVMMAIRALYFNDDVNMNRNDEKRILSAMIGSNVSRYSLNVMKKYGNGEMLPLAFVAHHDLNTECAELWSKVVDDCGGKQMCFDDRTIALVDRTLNDDSVHRRKETAIAAISSLSQMCCADEEQIDRLIDVVLSALPGRVWNGKIALFDALQKMTKHCVLRTKTKEKIVQCFVCEMQRTKHKEYRIAAMNGFAQVMCNFKQSVDVADQVVPILSAICQQYNEKEEKFLRDTSNCPNHTTKLQLKHEFEKDCEILCCAIKCFGATSKHVEFVIRNIYCHYLDRSRGDWIVSIAIYKSIQLFAKRCHFEKENKLLLTDLMQAICAGFDDLKYAAVRHQALAAAHQILAKCKQFMDADVMQKIKAKVEHMAQNDKKPIVVQQAIKLRNDIF